MGRRTSGRRGVAMVMVIVLVAVATVLGMAYLQSSSVRRIGSSNLPAAAQAKYLAESGLQHAFHTCQTNVSAMVASSQAAPIGPFFPNATSANYTFYAEAVSGQIGTFLLHAEGDSGTVKQKCSAMVRVAAAPEVTTPFALMVDAAGTTPSSLTIHGDIYVRETLWNYSTVDGDVLCADWVWDPLSRVDGQILKFVPLRTLPAVSAADYATYKLFGVSYDSTALIDVTGLTNTDPLANGGAITASNPGGVVKAIPPNGGFVQLTDDFNFTGTLIVHGDLRINGMGIQLTAVDGFPAIVCTGKIYVKSGADITIDGLVIASDGILPEDPADTGAAPVTKIKGGVLSSTVGYDSALRGAHELTYVPDRCRIYDFSENAELPKLEVLRWDD